MFIPVEYQEILNRKKIYLDCIPDDFKKFINDYNDFYGWSLHNNLRNIIRLIKQNVTYLPVCGLVGCNNTVYLKITTDYCVVQKGCCPNHHKRINNLEKYGVEHSLQDKNIRNKISQTNLKKYNAVSPLSNKLIQAKSRATVIEKYGVDNVMKISSVKEKCYVTKLLKYGDSTYNNTTQFKSTMIKKYGSDNPMKIESFKAKAISTSLEKYGVCYHLQSTKTQDKIKQTNLSKYGVGNVLEKNSSVRNKALETLYLKYGVLYPSQNAEILEKIIKNSYRFKKYVWIDGLSSDVQGNEPIVLKELENQGYTSNDILTSTKDMPEIWYVFEGKKHRYYPDFYIPKENLIIEVKSQYILDLHWDKNQAKFQAVKDAGFEFRLEVR